jgi:hypothetical protein
MIIPAWEESGFTGQPAGNSPKTARDPEPSFATGGFRASKMAQKAATGRLNK